MNKRNRFFVPVIVAAAFACGIIVPRVVNGFDVNVDVGNDHDHHHHHGMTHEEIDAAIGHLNSAKDDLFHSKRDFGGHRMKALHSIDDAIHHLHDALDYANGHDR